MNFPHRLPFAVSLVALAILAAYTNHLVRSQHRQIAGLKEQSAQVEANHQRVMRELAIVREQLEEAEGARERVEDATSMLAHSSRALSDNSVVAALAGDAVELKEWAERLPQYRIPEMRLLQERDWVLAMGNRTMETEVQARRAMSQLRQRAKNRLTSIMMEAVLAYRNAYEGRTPTDFDQLKPYFREPLEDAILDRYYFVPENPFDPRMTEWLITEKALIDEEYDSRAYITRTGGNGSMSTSWWHEAQREAEAAHWRAHGFYPENREQLRPFLEKHERADEILSRIPRVFPPSNGR